MWHGEWQIIRLKFQTRGTEKGAGGHEDLALFHRHASLWLTRALPLTRECLEAQWWSLATQKCSSHPQDQRRTHPLGFWSVLHISGCYHLKESNFQEVLRRSIPFNCLFSIRVACWESVEVVIWSVGLSSLWIRSGRREHENSAINQLQFEDCFPLSTFLPNIKYNIQVHTKTVWWIGSSKKNLMSDQIPV